LAAIGLAWNLLSIVVRIEPQEFGSGGWLELAGGLALIGAVVGLAWTVLAVYRATSTRDFERMDGEFPVIALMVGAIALILLGLFGFLYGIARVGEVLFGSFGIGLAVAFGLLLLGGGIVGGIWGWKHPDRPL
jgi:hypothetical protein